MLYIYITNRSLLLVDITLIERFTEGMKTLKIKLDGEVNLLFELAISASKCVSWVKLVSLLFWCT